MERPPRVAVCVFAALAALLALPARALDGAQLAIVVNTLDPLSVRIGDYYAARRHILFQNIIRVEIPPGKSMLTHDEFNALKAVVDEQTVPRVQAYALTWAAPYRVECMSITAAFAFGFDLSLCADGCKPTRVSRYFDSGAGLPFSQLGMRPAMAIAAETFEQAEALIDRGVAADGSIPEGTAYLLSTSDTTRNVRSAEYPETERILLGSLRVRSLRQDALIGARDVFFYFTGRAQVDGLATLGFLPGAVADHLTSTGGMLTDSSQMSALRWLEAGATGSYGTVAEPCNFPMKFPFPALLIARYMRGETLIEAYWKSVAWPGQGLFLGEPLAAPFRSRPR